GRRDVAIERRNERSRGLPPGLLGLVRADESDGARDGGRGAADPKPLEVPLSDLVRSHRRPRSSRNRAACGRTSARHGQAPERPRAELSARALGRAPGWEARALGRAPAWEARNSRRGAGLATPRC